MTNLFLVFLDCFPLFLHFFTSLIKFKFWLKLFYKRQVKAMEGKDHSALLISFMDLPFQTFHINRIIKYVVFVTGFLHLARKFSSFIYVVACISFFFFLQKNIPLYGHISVNISIYQVGMDN